MSAPLFPIFNPNYYEPSGSVTLDYLQANYFDITTTEALLAGKAPSTYTGTTGSNFITVPTNEADAFHFTNGTQELLSLVTTTGALAVSLPVPTTCHGLSATAVPLVVKGFASQSGDLQDWKDSSSDVLASVGSDGTVSSTVQVLTPVVDFAAAGGQLNIGPTNATSVVLGSGVIPTEAFAMKVSLLDSLIAEALPIGPTNATSVTITPPPLKVGTVTITNLVENSGTTDTTRTSASMSAPIGYGAVKQVAFSRLCSITGNSTTYDSAWSTTGVGAVIQSATLPNYFNYITLTVALITNNLIYTTPVSLAQGVYMVRYRMQVNNDAPIVQISYNPNSTGYITIRTGVDLYQAAVDNGPGSIFCEDYFSVTAAQAGTCLVKWQITGQNASSSSYNLFLIDSLLMFQIG